jgi:hypothetical protein
VLNARNTVPESLSTVGRKSTKEVPLRSKGGRDEEHKSRNKLFFTKIGVLDWSAEDSRSGFRGWNAREEFLAGSSRGLDKN